MSDGESVHSSAILSKAATGGRRGLKLNKRTQTNIYFQVLIRTSSGISISRKGALKLVNLSSLKIIHLKEQRYTFAKSRNFADVCMVGTQTSPLPYTRLENFETSRSLTLITFQQIILKHSNFTSSGAICSGVDGFSPTGPYQNLRKQCNGLKERFSQGQKRSFPGNL